MYRVCLSVCKYVSLSVTNAPHSEADFIVIIIIIIIIV